MGRQSYWFVHKPIEDIKGDYLLLLSNFVLDITLKQIFYSTYIFRKEF